MPAMQKTPLKIKILKLTGEQLNTVGIRADAKFLPTIAGTGLFKWARKSRILLIKKVICPFSVAIWHLVPGPEIADFPVIIPGKGPIPPNLKNNLTVVLQLASQF